MWGWRMESGRRRRWRWRDARLVEPAHRVAAARQSEVFRPARERAPRAEWSSARACDTKPSQPPNSIGVECAASVSPSARPSCSRAWRRSSSVSSPNGSPRKEASATVIAACGEIPPMKAEMTAAPWASPRRSRWPRILRHRAVARRHPAARSRRGGTARRARRRRGHRRHQAHRRLGRRLGLGRGDEDARRRGGGARCCGMKPPGSARAPPWPRAAPAAAPPARPRARVRPPARPRARAARARRCSRRP